MPGPFGTPKQLNSLWLAWQSVVGLSCFGCCRASGRLEHVVAGIWLASVDTQTPADPTPRHHADFSVDRGGGGPRLGGRVVSI